jgi:hypothetical protein
LKYLLIVLALALPQLIFFTFRGSGSFLKFTFNWANESDNYFWFYIKNFGLIACSSPLRSRSQKGRPRACRRRPTDLGDRGVCSVPAEHLRQQQAAL